MSAELAAVVSAPARARDAGRLRPLFDAHFDFVWRSLRRLGVGSDVVDDAAQEVFLVVARRLDDVLAGKEKSFLFGTAVRVASDVRRARSRRPVVTDEAAVERALDEGEGQDEKLDRERARAMLDTLLEEMEVELRAVFILYELEQMTMAEIAECLDLAPGTVASRLRRARQDWQDRVARLRAQQERGGGR